MQVHMRAFWKGNARFDVANNVMVLKARPKMEEEALQQQTKIWWVLDFFFDFSTNVSGSTTLSIKIQMVQRKM